MVDGHKITKNVAIENYISMINDYVEDEIILSDHALFRIREKDRKIFKDKVIKLIIRRISPIVVGLQKNGCYAAFYEYGGGLVLRVIIDVQPSKITIVTFYAIAKVQIPILK